MYRTPRRAVHPDVDLAESTLPCHEVLRLPCILVYLDIRYLDVLVHKVSRGNYSCTNTLDIIVLVLKLLAWVLTGGWRVPSKPKTRIAPLPHPCLTTRHHVYLDTRCSWYLEIS